MARIRTIKPEFFRHETLQDLGPISMLVFAGLLCQSDKHGVFPWRPRQLKLDILPFLDFDMEKVLWDLDGSGMVGHYSVDGKEYGQVLNFTKHQRLTGKEASAEGQRYPLPGDISETTGKQQGNIREEPESQEKERERGKGKGKGTDSDKVIPIAGDCPHKKIIGLYHSILPSLPAVQVWNKTSQENLKARWREDKDRQNLEWWESYFKRVAASDFLMGKKKDWRANLTWLVGPKNFEKVMNGNYDNKEKETYEGNW